MKMLSAKAVLVLGALIVPAHSSAGEGVMLEGLVDCGVWVQARQTQRAGILEGNLIGFINGLALGRGVDVWTSAGKRISREQAFLWMDNYCRTNPLESIWTGGYKLADEVSGGEFSRVGKLLP